MHIIVLDAQILYFFFILIARTNIQLYNKFYAFLQQFFWSITSKVLLYTKETPELLNLKLALILLLVLIQIFLAADFVVNFLYQTNCLPRHFYREKG